MSKSRQVVGGKKADKKWEKTEEYINKELFPGI